MHTRSHRIKSKLNHSKDGISIKGQGKHLQEETTGPGSSSKPGPRRWLRPGQQTAEDANTGTGEQETNRQQEQRLFDNGGTNSPNIANRRGKNRLQHSDKFSQKRHLLKHDTANQTPEDIYHTGRDPERYKVDKPSAGNKIKNGSQTSEEESKNLLATGEECSNHLRPPTQEKIVPKMLSAESSTMPKRTTART